MFRSHKITVFTLLILFFTVNIYGETFFKDIDISVSSRSAPRESDSITSKASMSLNNRWCVFSIEYTPKRLTRSGGYLWLDDVKLEGTAIFVGSSNGKPMNYILTGSCTFYTIRLDGRKHLALMMIPPHLLDRYLPSNKQKLDLNAISLEVKFKSKSGKVIGQGFLRGRGINSDAKAERYFASLKSFKPQAIVKGGLLHMSETPWMNHKFDDFDLVKRK